MEERFVGTSITLRRNRLGWWWKLETSYPDPKDIGTETSWFWAPTMRWAHRRSIAAVKARA